MTKKFLGKGEFSKAYLLPNGNVEVHSNDMVKEGIALFGTENSYLPQIYFQDNVDAEKGYNSVYIMPYYGENLLKSQVSNHQWKYYRILQNELQGGGIRLGNYFHYGRTRQEHTEIIEGLKIPPKMKEALIDLCDCTANVSDRFNFEFSPRNVRARYGRLFFLDCVAILEKREISNYYS